jgi:hypothetical protein
VAEAVVIRGALTSTDALCVVASLTGDLDARIEKEVVYPYYCFEAKSKVPTLRGRRALDMICLVDAVNGIGATADEFQLTRERLPAARLLATEIDADEALETARGTVTHRLGRKLRTITSFDVELVSRGLVHKRFWIVRSTDARIMVDSTNGSLHPLKMRAA